MGGVTGAAPASQRICSGAIRHLSSAGKSRSSRLGLPTPRWGYAEQPKPAAPPLCLSRIRPPASPVVSENG